MKQPEHWFSLQRSIVADLGCPLRARHSVLDFGCGDGELVHIYRKHGYDAFGCDTVFKTGPHGNAMRASGILRRIQPSPYRLPFDDMAFDAVVSHQVLEHIPCLGDALSELRRITRPGGVGLHVFPPRWRPIEPHVRIPLAGVIHSYPWLRFWTGVGVRSAVTGRCSARLAAQRSHLYLSGQTSYLPKSQLDALLGKHFEHIIFCEDRFIAHRKTPGCALVRPLARHLSIVPAMYSNFVQRIVFARRVS